ncbi:MAG: bifunctional 4-hydroxy-2-oxoglutarate aldolase/2-dehydro-3-deoxy-phosphogluconate aldolase [Caulobacteraceae bacterium]|nr:bifunctional 4-hydroxy-2-oxoglutarate aldolase/2-dehydro-3-deoxy-phosphogluconate aldolase [Caulobacteraceae bacterium]
MDIVEILGLAPVMPVVTIADPRQAGALARALAAGGLRAIEVTLRTPAALEAIAAIASEAPEALPGVGTALTPKHLEEAAKAGARFAVSPGATPTLLDAARSGPLPYLPAIATASELMAAMERDYSTFKFFPAAACGGPAALKALAGPFPDARFCPTGGIDAESAPAYLALTNVLCVGGSWVVPAPAVARGDFAEIEQLARAAAGLKKPSRGTSGP